MSGHASTYEPKGGLSKWIDARLPVPRLIHDSFVDFPTPKNLNYWYTFGGILAVCLAVQIITGIVLAMHYTATVDQAFASVERIMRDVPYGWLLRYTHAVGASMFFLAVYIHMFRGLYYGSYKAPREVLWILGVVIFLLMMATAFLGYMLPWGQMSLHGANVIISLFGALPLIGEPLQTWLQGGPAVGNATLQRFFSLHYLLPFMIAGVVILHIWALHVPGNNNPTGVEVKDTKADTVPFHPYYTVKDAFAIVMFLIVFAAFIFYAPNVLGHADNYIPADQLVTPAHIVPEWYLLPFYAILRAITFDIGPISAQLLGIVAMFAAIGVLFFLPWLDTSKVRSMRYRPVAKQFFIGFVAVSLLLGLCGAKTPTDPVVSLGSDKLVVEYTQISGDVRNNTSAFASQQDAQAFADRLGDLNYASVAEPTRDGEPWAVNYLTMANGATPAASSLVESSRTFDTFAEADAFLIEQRAETNIPAQAVDLVIEKPWAFTYESLSQILTLYYFAYFLLILPLLGLTERPRNEPESIAKSVLERRHGSQTGPVAVPAE